MENTMSFLPIVVEPYAPLSYLNGAIRVLAGECPEHNSSFVSKESCELVVEKGSDTLLVCIGESWTWGESLINGKWPDGSFRHMSSGLPGHGWPTMRIEDTWPGKMARMMGSDLHVHSVPGNSNRYHVEALERIIKECPRGKYKKICYVIQLTDPARDQTDDFLPGDPRYKLFIDLGQSDDTGPKLTMPEWLEAYDNAYFEKINSIISDNTDLPLEGCLWKNFNNILGKTQGNKFTVVELPYIRWAAKMCGLDDIELPGIQAAPWWVNHMPRLKILKELPSIDYINDQLTKIETQYRFIIATPTAYSELNRTHPSLEGHIAWAVYLCEKMNWVDF
jgi:hypothetical protein